MAYGERSSRQRPYDAVSSSRVPSVERRHPVPCRPLRPEPEDSGQVAQADHDSLPGVIGARDRAASTVRRRIKRTLERGYANVCHQFLVGTSL